LATAASSNPPLRFGVFELDAVTGELRKSGHTIRLRPQAAKILVLLASRPGQLITREVLREKIWGNETFVDFEHGLNLCIREVRAALDDDADTPRYVETLPKRGYRFIAPVEGAKRTVSRFAWRRIAVFPAILLAIAAVAVIANPGHWRERILAHARPPVGRVMFAVLPFENLSGDLEQEYFSDGLTEEMISRLGQLEPRRLGVIARTSAIQYKGTKKRIDQIGKELGVDYILEGTVRHAGGRVRVSAQLIQVSDQTHIWAKNYERDLQDILALQEEVAQAIAGEVEIRLTPQQQARLESAPVNAAAFQAYLKGRYYLTRISGRDLQKALDYFKEATAIDPNYALGYAGLAETYNAMNTLHLAPVETEPKAKAAALKALALDEALPLAHAALGRVRLFYDWDWPGAEKEFLRALELNPSLPEAHLGYAAYLITSARFDESVEHILKTFALDPLSVSARFEGIGHDLYVSRRYEQTLDECRKVKELPPDFTEPFAIESFVYARLGRSREAARAAQEAVSRSNSPLDLAMAAQAYAESGDKEKARQVLRQILVTAQTQFVCGYSVATVYASLGETDRAFHWLEEGLKQRSL
jgi:TolB-like protein/DNA-binding winged helix-turn-helix (wHTH) protein/Tfp pilus assembly protein PilF